MLKKMLTLIFLTTLTLAFLQSCDSTEPDDNRKLTLTVEDVSATEVELKLTTTFIDLPATIQLTANSKTVDIFTLSIRDTLVNVDSLEPSTSYSFQALYDNIISEPVTAITKDTTSHNFTWQSWTFGEHSSSRLNDVAIIDKNNIWAVGQIYLKDSLGNSDPLGYNVAQWGGNNWELRRISVEFRGSTITVPLDGIFVFAPNDIWLVGSLPIYGNGVNWRMFDLRTTVDPNLSLSKAWGPNANDMYFVGGAGSIAHYNGTSWKRIQSGTDLNINDIWGITNNNGENFVLCSAYNFASGGAKKLLSIDNSNIIGEIPWVENRSLYTLWFNTKDKIYAGGEGLFYRKNNQWTEETLPALFKFRVRGLELNDIWTVGGKGFAAHFNGANWKSYDEISLSAGNYQGLAVKNNLVVITGSEGRKAIVTIGKR